jgi:VanZ family protein
LKSWTTEETGRLKKIIEKLSPEDGEFIWRIIHRDPLKGIYIKLMLIYVLLLGVFLLWPFDFIFKVKNDARWIGNSNGIEFLGAGQAVSDSSTQELFDRLVKGSGLTLEVWLQTEDLNQAGPARIISYSINKELSNFTLGQAWDKLIVRFRTTRTRLNGTTPHIVIIDTFSHRNMQHVVVAYDFSEERVSINGEQRTRSNVLKGDFSNWDTSCRLVIGNEVTGDMPWKGKIYYAAIFDRALTEQEIHQNYVSGLRLIKEGSVRPSSLRTKNPVARYTFDEGKGVVIHDSGLASKPVNLFIPKYIKHKKESFFSFSMGSLQIKSRFPDLIINILIFIPFGILIHGMLRARFGPTLKISLATLLSGTLFTLGIESLQHFSMTRQSSLIDVSTNMSGTIIGILIDRAYNLFLNYRAKQLRMLLYDRKE